MNKYSGTDKSLARRGRKQATATEDFDIHISPIYNHNWRNISTTYIYIYIYIYTYIYNKTTIKGNILNIKQNISGIR